MTQIFIVGGGTGGHLFSAVSLAQDLMNKKIHVLLITDTRCQKYLDSNSKIFTKIFHIGNLSSNVKTKFFTACRIIFTILLNIKLIYKHKPICVVSFGGYTSLPTLIAAKIMRTPIILHEQNSILGKVNQIFASSARIIALNFSYTHKILPQYLSKTVVVGNPIRPMFAKTKKVSSKSFNILIIAGSQGAKAFDELMPETIKLLVEKTNRKIKIIEQVTQDNYQKVKDKLLMISKSKFEFIIDTFFKNMEDLYQQADLVIARSGASTISELIETATPSILIPLPSSAQNHQFFNASEIAKKGACIYIEQTSDLPDKLSRQILNLLEDKNILKNMNNNLIFMRTTPMFADLLIDSFNLSGN